MTDKEITIKEYFDACMTGINKNIADLRDYIEQHFTLNDKALKLANEDMLIRLENIGKEMVGLDKRLQEVEKTKAVSAGQVKLMVGILTAIPTILALIALFIG